MEKLRVLIVDDRAEVRRELSAFLPLAANIEIAGEAADGLAAVGWAAALAPDVVLLDLHLPEIDGYQVAYQIKSLYPTCRVIALSLYADKESRERAQQAGCDAFVSKSDPLEELLETILGESERGG